MNTCECGSLADGNGTTCRRCAALHELGLRAGATEVEVKTAYRLYVKAWHPDRFPGDEKSKSAAQEKLKAINSAYDYLASSSSKGPTYRPKPDAPPRRPQEPPQQKQNSAKQPPPTGGRDQASPPKGHTGGRTQPPTPSTAHRWGILFGLAARRWGYLLYLPGVLGLFALWGAISTSSKNRPPATLPSDFSGWDISSQPARSNSAEVKGLPPGLTVYPIDNPTQPAFSLPNGTEIRKRGHLNGRGELTVENGTSYDAVVLLVDLNTGKTIRTFYVVTGNAFTERQISPGLYGLYFSTGTDWNTASKTFNSAASYSHFGENLEYTEKIDQATEKVETITYKISLQPVQGGNAEIEPSDKDSFDKIMNDGSSD